jgi:zinc/manganese transport system permease protein
MNATLDFSILGPAFLAGVIVLATHVPLGQQVLARGIIFLDLAVAQIAGLGVIGAVGFGWEPGGWQVQLIATASALAGAGLLYMTDKAVHKMQEALIGSVFVLTASLGILLLAASPHAGENLKELLVGQILWVNPNQLILAAFVSVTLLGFLNAWRKRSGAFAFYAVFAVAVTLSVQLVGVYLVFASLIFPALATHTLKGSRALFTGWVVGAAGYGIGIVISALVDLPTGAVVVCTLALAAGVFAFSVRSKKF